jgi:hypothetical protein
MVAQSAPGVQSESVDPFAAQAVPDCLFPDLPPLVQMLLGLYLQPILDWLSAGLYDRLLAADSQHPLCLIAQHYDLGPLIERCAAYYHTSGPGSTPTYTVAQLLRAEIVRAYAGSCSSPALAAHLRTNLLARWFVGLSLFGPTPSEDTLERFHHWLNEHHPDALFRDVLAFLDRVDPEDPKATPQIVDTFAMHSPAAPQSPAVVLMRLTAQLACHWLAVYPHDCVPVLPADFDLHKLRTSRASRSKAKGQRQLAHAVASAQAVIAALEPLIPRAEEPLPDLLPPIIAQLQRVIAADTTTDANGKVIEKERPKGKKREEDTYRIVSATDPEATFRQHTGHPAILGYNATVSVTGTRICGIVAPTGGTPDSLVPELILQQEQAHEQPLPEILVMDKAGGQAKTRARVHAVSDGQTRMVAHLMTPGGRDPNLFGPEDFRVTRDPETRQITAATCPAGKTTTTFYASGTGDGVKARFTVKQHCADCPLWAQCRPATGKADSHRTVFLSDYHHHQRQAAAFNATDEGQALLAGRWKVEPVISWLVNYQGCRRARRVGQAAAEFQLFQACAVRNLLMWINRRKRM